MKEKEHRVENEKEGVEILKEKIIKKMRDHEVTIFTFANIENLIGWSISTYQVRKALKELEKEGLIKKQVDTRMDKVKIMGNAFGGRTFCKRTFNTYTLTQ